MQYLLCAMGGVASLLVFLYLPETAHFRGIDLLREERALHRAAIAAKEAEAGTGVSSSNETAVETETSQEPVGSESRRMRFSRQVASWREDAIWLNPLVAIKILVNPHILAMVSLLSTFSLCFGIDRFLQSLNSSFILMSTYTILVPLAYTLAARYNITDAALLGTLYLASGTSSSPLLRNDRRLTASTLQDSVMQYRRRYQVVGQITSSAPRSSLGDTTSRKID